MAIPSERIRALIQPRYLNAYARGIVVPGAISVAILPGQTDTLFKAVPALEAQKRTIAREAGYVAIHADPFKF